MRGKTSMPGDLSGQFLIEMKVEPQTKADVKRLMDALTDFAQSDETFGVAIDAESGEIILKGATELHLDEKVQMLRVELGIGVSVGPPQVAYRETIAREAICDYTHKRERNGSRQFARLTLKVSPRDRDLGNVFTSEFRDDAAIAAFAAGVEKGVNSVLKNGVLIGFPVVDVAVAWVDGAFHEVDSDGIAFEIAARGALKEAIEKAGVILLEPIMNVKVTVPADEVGPIIGYLQQQRGSVFKQKTTDADCLIEARVPLANMFGIRSVLRSMTSGTGAFEMTFSHYAEVPRNVSDPNDPDRFPPAIGMRA
jgi:elongation factor G